MVKPELTQAVEMYKMSPKAQETLKNSQLVVFVGISGAGKNTLIQELLKTGDFRFVVSHTTRPPRVNDGVMEENGNQYWFISEDEMIKKLKHGEMLEAKVIYGRQVSGASVEELKRAEAKKQVPVNEIEIQGVEALRVIKPDLRAFFILPPSFSHWLQRINNRGKMSDDEFKARLQTAVTELTHCLESHGYIFVINDDIVGTALYIQQILNGDLDIEERKERSEDKAQALLADLESHLSSLQD